MRRWLHDNRHFVMILLLFGFVRTAVADWNPVPTGSMRPTILEGDVVFVNRLAYDVKLPLTDRILLPLGEPRRGDIVTFSSPKDGTRLIKRIAAVPGDTISMRGNRLPRSDALRSAFPHPVLRTLVSRVREKGKQRRANTAQMRKFLGG